MNSDTAHDHNELVVVTYFDKLRAASVARDSLLCIGLDPDPKVIRGGLEGAVDFCRTLIHATSDVTCCYKPNAAFWEQYGPRGWEGLATVKKFVPPDIPVLLDCKRADVPNTMAAYRGGSACFVHGRSRLLSGRGSCRDLVRRRSAKHCHSLAGPYASGGRADGWT